MAAQKARAAESPHPIAGEFTCCRRYPCCIGANPNARAEKPAVQSRDDLQWCRSWTKFLKNASATFESELKRTRDNPFRGTQFDMRGFGLDIALLSQA
jgi:hypothetical protein